MTDAEQIFRDTIHTLAKDHNLHNYELEIKPLSSGGANYTSHLFLAKIQASEDYYVFGKVASCGKTFREQAPMNFYYSERYFYNILYKIYRELEEKSKVTVEDRLKLPKYYGCNPNLYEETIILEDLGSRGFTTHDRMKSYDWEYASAAVSQLAKFHALSMAYLSNNNEEFNKDIEQLKVKTDYVKDKDWESYLQGAVKPALDAVSEENKDKLRKYIDENYKTNPSSKVIATNKIKIIVHGDYRPSNLMHRTLEDGKVEIIPVDYQTLHGGSPLVDLLYFIYTGSDEEFRRLHYQQLIDHYYSELSAAMARLGVDADTYSREDFEDELKEKNTFGLYVAIFILPMVTVEFKNAAQVDKDTDIREILQIENVSHLYPERLNGIINDYVRWGILT